MPGPQERANIRQCLMGLNLDAPDFEEQLLNRVTDTIAQAVQAKVDHLRYLYLHGDMAGLDDALRARPAEPHA